MFEYINSQRNKPILIHEDFIYNFDSRKDMVSRWRCQNRLCRGSVYIKESELISKNVHNHNSDAVKCEKLRRLYNIKIKSISSNERPAEIIIPEFISLPAETTLSMPNKKYE
jgi:hypothetical protein